MGKGALAPPLEILKSVFAVNVVLVDEVFMRHFEKMSSASGASPTDAHRGYAPGP